MNHPSGPIIIIKVRLPVLNNSSPHIFIFYFSLLPCKKHGEPFFHVFPSDSRKEGLKIAQKRAIFNLFFSRPPENSMNFRGTRRLPSQIASDLRRETSVSSHFDTFSYSDICPDSEGVRGKPVLFLIFPPTPKESGKIRPFFPTPILFTIPKE